MYSQTEFECYHLNLAFQRVYNNHVTFWGMVFACFYFCKMMVRIKCNKVWNSFELVIILRRYREVGMPLEELLRNMGREEGW